MSEVLTAETVSSPGFSPNPVAAPMVAPTPMIPPEGGTTNRAPYTFDDLHDLPDAPEFQSLSDDEKGQIMDLAIADVHAQFSQEPDYDYATFGQFAEKARARALPGKVVKFAKDLGTGTVNLAKDLSAVPATAPLMTINPLDPGSGANAVRVGQAVGSNFLRKGAELTNVVMDAGERYLSGNARTLHTKVDKLVDRIKKGDFPHSNPDDLLSWLKEEDAELYPLQQKYHGSSIAEKARLATPQAAALLADYIQTRNPAALEELKRAATITRGQVKFEELRQKNLHSAGAQIYESFYGPGSYEHAQAGFDPLNFIFTGRAAKALTTAGKLKNAAKFGAEMTGYGALNAIRANPDASLSDVGEESLKMILMGGAIHGGAYAARRVFKKPTPENPVNPVESSSQSASESAGVPPEVMTPAATVAQAPPDPVTTPKGAAGSSPAAGSPVTETAPAAHTGPLADVFTAADAALSSPAVPESPSLQPQASGLRTTFDPTRTTAGYLNADLINHGVDLIARGIRDFAQWSMEMLRKFTDAIRPHLQSLWNAIVPEEVRNAGPGARGSGLGASGVSDKADSGGGTGGSAPAPPRAVPTDTWETPRFSKRVQASDALKGDWHSRFAPQSYEKKTHEQWAQFQKDAGQWVNQHGAEAAADLVMDMTSGLAGDERVILASEAMRAADARAVRGDTAANQLSAELADFMGTFGSKGGQTVAAYGFLTERDPTLTLADAEREHSAAVEKEVETKLKTPAKTVADTVKKVAADEKEKAVKDVEKKSPKIVEAAKRIIGRLARQFSDTPPEVKAQVRSAVQQLHDLTQRGLREHIPDFRQQAEALGVHPAEATQLHRLVEEGRRRAAAVAREKAGQKLIDSFSKTATTRAKMLVPKFVQNLLDAWQHGVLGRSEFLDAFAKAYDMPHFTPEIRTKLQTLVRAAREAPEGTPKAEAMRALQDELAIHSGVKAGDALISAWYANLLSGLGTQGINVWGNLTNLLLRAPIAMMMNPKDALGMLSGLLRGAGRGGSEFLRILGGGVQHKSGEKYADTGALERIKRQGGPQTFGQWAAWLGSAGPVGRYVFRGLSAMDSLFYYTALEGRAQLAASRAVRQRGLKPFTPEFSRAVAEELGMGKERWQTALDQATAEQRAGTIPNRSGAVTARALEIVEAERPAPLRAESHRYGDLTTYNYEPEGNAGKIYQMLTAAQNVKVFGVPVFRPFVPFARMVANLTANNLDFTPVGILRGLKGNYLGAGKDTPMAKWESRERLAAGIVGGAATAAVASWAYSNKDQTDADTQFMIYGKGPTNKELMPKGWRPYTIKIGDKFVSYAETPLALALAPVGAIMDRVRYTKNWDEKDATERAGYYMSAMGGAVTSQGVLSSMANLMDVMNGKRKPTALVSSVTSGMVPAQGLLRDANTLFDGTKIDTDTLASAIFRDVPVIRGKMGRPALNVWGEPVKFEGLDRIPVVKRVVTGGGAPDPVSDWLGRHRLTVPGLPQSVDAGQYLPPEEKAAKLNRIHAGIWTETERYEFARKSGQRLKETLRNWIKAVPPQPGPMTDAQRHQWQLRVDAMTESSRRLTMREMMK